MSAPTYGWRAKIGSISPSLFELHPGAEPLQILPPGVVITITTLNIVRLTPEEFDRAYALYEEAARRLAAMEVQFIVAGGSPVIAAKGPGADEELGRRMREASGVPAMAGLTAVIEALRTLKVKRLVLVTPYPTRVTAERAEYLRALGFDVVHTMSLEVERNADLRKLPAHASFWATKEAMKKAPSADGVYISCSAWPTLDNIAGLERDLGIPVVSNIQSYMWGAFRGCGIGEPIHDYGRLLELPRS